MREIERDSDLIERRKTWKTVSFGGMTTYNAFDLGGRVLMKDIARIGQHKRHMKPLDFDYLMEHIWDDVFVEPSSTVALDMDLYDGYTLLDCVVIPHINVCGYEWPSISFIQSISGMLRRDSVFIPAEDFLHSMRVLSMVKGGADVITKLIKDNSQEYFLTLLNDKIEFVDDDFRTYNKDSGKKSPGVQTLFLPGWVRNRLSHPENRFERSFPDVEEYARATYLLSAITLKLLYQRQEPLFG